MTPQSLALVLARLFSAVYVAIGLTWCVALVALFLLGAGPLKDFEPLIDPTIASLFSYGLMYTAAGLGLLLFSRRIAAFAAKIAPSSEER
ncbi:MAG: hypothetical protein JO021_00265 [Alphaproteobacteria bacterium]|nr:hypothetical protein [Alphaproteobacteria bacterium]